MTGTRRAVPAYAALGSIVLSTVVLAGCDDTDDASVAPSVAPVPTTVASDGATLRVRGEQLATRVGTVAGHLPSAQRRALVRRLTGIVASWVDAGFVSGDYPRDDFSKAFSRFTPVAARLASRQQRITTNAALGPDLVELVPTRQKVTFSIFAPDGRAAGATADVSLVLLGVLADDREVEVAVAGQLYLTRDPGWRIFGFDLQREVRAPGSDRRGRP